MSGNAHLIGIIVGIAVGLILVAIIYKTLNVSGNGKTEYDERQQIVRGRGYMYGFYCEIIAFALYAVFKAFEEEAGWELPIILPVQLFIVMLIGIMVEIGYCIFHDGYFGLNNDKKKYYISFFLIGLSNILIGFANTSNGKLWTDGKLGLPMLNYLCGAMFIVIGIMIIIHNLIDKSEVEEEDEE